MPGSQSQLAVQVSKKRTARDQKFGFGGRKRLGKQNDADSAADMDAFRPARFGGACPWLGTTAGAQQKLPSMHQACVSALLSGQTGSACTLP